MRDEPTLLVWVIFIWLFLQDFREMIQPLIQHRAAREFRQGLLLVDKFSLLIELLLVKMNTTVEDSTWLEEILAEQRQTANSGEQSVASGQREPASRGLQ